MDIPAMAFARSPRPATVSVNSERGPRDELLYSPRSILAAGSARIGDAGCLITSGLSFEVSAAFLYSQAPTSVPDERCGKSLARVHNPPFLFCPLPSLLSYSTGALLSVTSSFTNLTSMPL